MSFIGALKRKFSTEQTLKEVKHLPSDKPFALGVIPKNLRYLERLEFVTELAKHDLLPWQYSTRVRFGFWLALGVSGIATAFTTYWAYRLVYQADELTKEMENRKNS